MIAGYFEKHPYCKIRKLGVIDLTSVCLEGQVTVLGRMP